MSENRSSSDRRSSGLDTPSGLRHGAWDRLRPNPDSFGQMTEGFARFMGTPQFLMWMTVFVVVWLGWNTFMPESLQFDPRALNYTLLTLMLSLQASYAAPLLLLAQNRQDDRDRVIADQDRRRDEENLADTEYLIREIASLRLAVRDVATRDFVRSEMRDLLQELLEDRQDGDDDGGTTPKKPSGPGGAGTPKKKKRKKTGPGESRDSKATPTGLIPVVSPPPDSPQAPAPSDAQDDSAESTDQTREL
ncbi:DUF1003 domain-containing protein [Kocuria coralli]|uniref:DUF1003 domain-containing protein n=1 Tax=Kocuria coralli TaxID=1461025 RepID=A0A5J5L3F8_9MICC|nr:DUF1003 domain-containing protein [Kocuria coralli]KAA9395541.1 DUF1003 domain-containing protein [Kocuria coralli]